MSIKSIPSLLIFVLGLACTDNQIVTSPAATPVSQDPGHAMMVSASATTFAVFEYGDFTPPTVKILRSGNGSPVPGILVAFTSSDGTVASAVTDATGIARDQTWRPDFSKSEDDIVAAADGISGSVAFKALQKTVIATYDLQSIGGKALPLTYGGGGNTWQITGGHYVLFDDGTYVFGYDENGKPGFGWLLPYVKRDSGFEFYLSQASAPQSQFYANLNYLFSTATLSDQLMSVKYSDTIDFEDEIYVLRQ